MSEITQVQLNALENALDKIFGKVGIDVEFTRHFIDRVNDERNVRQITLRELGQLFAKTYQKYGKPIAQLGPDAEAVLKDMASDINVPFALEWNSRTQMLELIAKTVMRKKNFHTPDKEFAVEARKDPMQKEVLVQGMGKFSLGGLQENLAGKFADLAKKAASGDPYQFRQIEYHMNHGVLDAMMKAVIQAYDELAKQTVYRREFGENVNSDTTPLSEYDVSKMYEKWTKQYKDSIDCNNPKGFSQKAHCAGKKKK
tara:strand:- start:402 stop:1169 length:768 start_codon:yes stop_codon:yes gene_type:complete